MPRVRCAAKVHRERRSRACKTRRVQRGVKLLACIDGVICEITPTVMADGVLRELTEVPAMIDGINRELGVG